MNAQRFFHFAASAILLVWGVVMLYFYTSGRVASYLAPAFRVGPLIAGLGLCVVALFNLATSRLGFATCGHGHHHHHGCGHEDHDHECDHQPGRAHEHHHACGHEHHHEEPAEAKDLITVHAHEPHTHAEHDHAHEPETHLGVIITALIALAPVLAAASLTKDAITTATLANKGLFSNVVSATATVGGLGQNQSANPSPKQTAPSSSDRYTLADLEKQVRKSPEGNFMIPVPSLFYSSADEELASVLEGQPLETIGQVVKESAENDPNGTRLRIFRVFISCCLADARPVGFSLEFGKAPPVFEANTWVKVTGSMSYPKVNGRPVALLNVKSIEKTPAPEEAMF